MNQPLISIVTPCLNRVDFIREAVESVLAQNYPSFEHIITDAGSTDGTLDVLRSYPHLRWISEPDRGIFDGLNKALRMVRGDIVGWLNTDDILDKDCFAAVLQAFEQNPDALAVVGGVTIFYDDETGRHTFSSTPTIEPDELWYRLIEGHPVTNGWFFRRQVLDRGGYYDDRRRYANDRYYLIHVALDCGVRPVPIHQALYHYRQHSGSGTMSNRDSRAREYGLLRMKMMREDALYLEEFLDRPVLPPEVRRRMRREHGARCYRLAATGLYHRQGGDVAWAVSHGWRRNPLWPLVFIRMGLGRIWKGLTGRE